MKRTHGAMARAASNSRCRFASDWPTSEESSCGAWYMHGICMVHASCTHGTCSCTCVVHAHAAAAPALRGRRRRRRRRRRARAMSCRSPTGRRAARLHAHTVAGLQGCMVAGLHGCRAVGTITPMLPWASLGQNKTSVRMHAGWPYTRFSFLFDRAARPAAATPQGA